MQNSRKAALRCELQANNAQRQRGVGKFSYSSKQQKRRINSGRTFWEDKARH